MLGGTIEKADMFCGEPPRTLREDSIEYFASSDN
jgi:hypothetical protein